jgi:hypothetical protein
MPYTPFTPPQAYLFLQRLYASFPFQEREITRIPTPHWYREWEPRFTDEERTELARYLQPETADTCIIEYSRSRSVAVSLCFSLFATSLLPLGSRLGYAFSSNQQGTGKTLLAKIPLYATSGKIHYESWRPDDDKMRASLDACAQSGNAHILFDNAPAHIPLGSSVLEAFMTLPTWEGRIYNRNDSRFEVPLTTTVILTANNLNLNADLARRFLRCDLFVTEANILDRKVSGDDLDDEILSRPSFRANLLGALWSLMATWDIAGRPLATDHLRPGYRAWCQLVGGLTLHTGFGDPLLPPPTGSSTSEQDQAYHLIQLLVAAAAPDTIRVEHTLDELIQALYENDLWTWTLKGKEHKHHTPERGDYVTFEPEHACKVKVGQRLAKYCPHRDKKNPTHHRLYNLGPDHGTWTACTEGTGSYKRFLFEKAS